jgi:hypothetical protein
MKWEKYYGVGACFKISWYFPAQIEKNHNISVRMGGNLGRDPNPLPPK